MRCIRAIILFLITINLFNCSKKNNTKSLRIVSLSPAMTEIIFALGGEHYLVGTTTFCTYPEAAKKTYKVGDFSHPSLERILAQKPSLVVVNPPEQNHIIRELKKLKIPLFISQPRCIEDIYKEISEIGHIIKKEDQADSLVNFMKNNLKPIKKDKIKTVYVELSSRPLITVGQKSFLNELISLTGGKNIFTDIKKAYPIVTQEEIIRRNPDIVILLHPGNIKDRLGWQKLEAVKRKQVYKNLNPDILLRPGPRLVQGYNKLKKILSE